MLDFQKYKSVMLKMTHVDNEEIIFKENGDLIPISG